MSALNASQPDFYPVRSDTPHALSFLVGVFAPFRQHTSVQPLQLAWVTQTWGYYLGFTPVSVTPGFPHLTAHHILRILAGYRVHGRRSDLRRGLQGCGIECKFAIG